MTIRQAPLCICGAADCLCSLLGPGKLSFDDLRMSAPGLVDAIRLKGVVHRPQHEARERVSAEIIRFLHGIKA